MSVAIDLPEQHTPHDAHKERNSEPGRPDSRSQRDTKGIRDHLEHDIHDCTHRTPPYPARYKAPTGKKIDKESEGGLCKKAQERDGHIPDRGDPYQYTCRPACPIRPKRHKHECDK